MRIKISIFLLFFAFTGIALCKPVTISVEYRNGKTETVKKALFIDTLFFHSDGRRVVINPKRLDRMDIFADTIKIHFGETWVRADIYPASKDSIPPVHHGYVKVNTRITGKASFGNLSTSLSELRQIIFRPSKKTETETENPVDNVNGIGNEEEQE